MTIPEKTRIPTDDDAVFRPKCWGRDHVNCSWDPATLLHVVESPTFTNYRFCVITSSGRSHRYRQCIIEDIPQSRLSISGQRAAAQAGDNLSGVAKWCVLPQGKEFWELVYQQLRGMGINGTTDGKPYVKPEPKYREPTLADVGEMVEFDGRGEWDQRGKLLAIIDHESKYIVAPENGMLPIPRIQARIKTN